MTRINLGDIIRGGVPEPERICGDRLYAGRVHSLAGDMGAGKTTLAAQWGLGLRDGGRVAMLDEESGHNQIALRLIDIGATAGEASQIEYHEYPGSDLAYWEELAVKMQKFKADGIPSLVIIDSAAMALANAGLEENSNTDATKLWKCLNRISRAPRQHSVLMIDQLAKNTPESKYGRGATQKGYVSDVVYKLEVVKEWDRDTDGLASLTRTKDRDGFIRHRERFQVLRNPLRFEPGDGQQDAGSWKPTIYMEKVSEAMEREQALPGAKPLSKNQIEKLVSGNHDRVREAVTELISSGHIEPSAGSRGTVYSLKNLYLAQPRPTSPGANSGEPRPSPRPIGRGEEARSHTAEAADYLARPENQQGPASKTPEAKEMNGSGPAELEALRRVFEED